MFFGGKKAAKPAEVIKSSRDALAIIEKNANNPKAIEKAVDEVQKSIVAIRSILFGEAEHEPNPENAVQFANEVYASDWLPVLIQWLGKYDFETKREIVAIFNNLLKRAVGSRYPTVEYIARNPTFLDTLILGYEAVENPYGTTTGAMLRECIKHESLNKLVLTSPQFWKFFKYVESANFDVATDAFVSMKESLTKNKAIVAEFLEKNYDQFFTEYTTLLNSANYVTKRQSLKLLGELLLDRANFTVMTKYIGSSDNLKLLMTLLRDKSKAIQFESFHVFKVFVANPNKPQPILNILCKNKERLISFLNNFHNDKEDEQFADEKAFLLKQIQQLPTI